MKKTTTLSKAAFYQYLRFEKGMTYQAIADMCLVSNRNVWNKCNGEWGCTPWEERTKEEKKLAEEKYPQAIKEWEIIKKTRHLKEIVGDLSGKTQLQIRISLATEILPNFENVFTGEILDTNPRLAIKGLKDFLEDKITQDDLNLLLKNAKCSAGTAWSCFDDSIWEGRDEDAMKYESARFAALVIVDEYIEKVIDDYIISNRQIDVPDEQSIQQIYLIVAKYAPIY